jgi:hypothetical protein
MRRTLPTIGNLDKSRLSGLTRRSTRIYIGLVKWRNQLLALFCLLAFAGLGVVYFQHWVVRKPFGIILFIGEGLDPGRLAPTRLCRRRRYPSEPRFNEPSGFADQLFEDFAARTRPPQQPRLPQE